MHRECSVELGTNQGYQQEHSLYAGFVHDG